MIWPKISVVTPSFNQGPFIEQTLQSVLGQHYPNLEYIVIDGGSSDGAKEIIERYSPQLSYWISEPDQGQTQALVKGFTRATGDILCWLNSDDLFEPDTLRQVAEYFVQHPGVQVVYGDALWMDRTGKILAPKKEHDFNRFVWFFDHNYIPQPSLFWRRELFLQVGGMDASYELAMDTALIAKFLTVTTPQHVTRIWSRIRRYPEQRNQRLRAQSDRDDMALRECYCGKQTRLELLAKYALAKSMRVTLKLFNGCYW